MYDGEFQPPPPAVDLVPGDIHIWRAKLDLPDSTVQEYELLLCGQEKMKAAKYHFKRDRNRFVVGRALLKTYLAKYLNIAPSKIRICNGKNGKPYLYGAVNDRDLRFNLSHSEDCALYAFARRNEIGVDIEKMQAFPEMSSLAERFFSKRECALINALSINDRVIAFFTFWTRKEAISKLTGNGLQQALEKLDVALPQSKAFCSPKSAYSSKISSRYFIRDLHPWPGFVATVAAVRDIGKICCWQWQT